MLGAPDPILEARRRSYSPTPQLTDRLSDALIDQFSAQLTANPYSYIPERGGTGRLRQSVQTSQTDGARRRRRIQHFPMLIQGHARATSQVYRLLFRCDLTSLD